MTKAQRIIKYLAIAFALYLIINILGGIFWGIGLVASGLGLNKNDRASSEHLQQITTDIASGTNKTLKINLDYTDLRIVTGDKFLVESSSSDISCKQNGDQIIVKENSNGFWELVGRKANSLTVYIPEDMILDGVEIDTGAGTVSVETLNAKELYCKLGAGDVRIEQLNVSDKTTIDGGVGMLTIRNSSMHNLDLDLGVGKTSITGSLTGDTEIDSGIGQVTITLVDALENYRFDVDKGIGSVTIDGTSVGDDSQYGTGPNRIELSGGIGEIDVKTK